MNKILLIGNGFDIAHGLKTKYNDFLNLLKNWDTIYNMQESKKVLIPIGENNKSIMEDEVITQKNLEKLNDIISDNSWVKYYVQCKSELDGWIDFEKEIYIIIDFFEKLLKDRTVTGIEFIPGFDKYCMNWYGDVLLLDHYKIGENRVKSSTLLEDLRKEFDDFIVAMEIYLYEFVWKNAKIKPIKQIKEINADYVINFNYTSTEKIYGIPEKKTHHIHGKLRNNWEDEHCNMVLGIDENQYENIDFTYYMKFFQRIQKRTGIDYKKFVKDGWNEDGYELYIYGHSLDKTDDDILKYLIMDEESAKHNKMKANRVTIFYYNQQDYERKVLNLINIYNRAVVEHFIDNDKIQFVQTSDELA